MKVVISDNVIPEVLEIIKATGAEIDYKPENLEAALEDADALVIRSATKVTPELLTHAPKLKLVVRGGVGLDNVDREECKKRGIEVANTPGASTNAVAELALGLMLSAARHIPRATTSTKEGRWEKKQLTGSELSGKTLGLIGCGRIGSALGEKAAALGMKIIGYNPPPRHESELIEYVDNLDDFLGRADFISLHVPSTPKTDNMVNAETISKMRDGVILINTARGSIIEEDALYDALQNGKVRAAALDVYQKEPYVGKLSELENTILTPHVAASTSEAQIRIGEEIAQKIKGLMG